jgi:ATP-dependent DNA helicase RecQ
VVRDTKHLYKSKEIVFFNWKVNAVIKAHRTDVQSFFGCGVDHDEKILDDNEASFGFRFLV